MADIVVCGYAVRHPLAGNVFAYAHYVAGFRKLGHRLLYAEESGWARPCFDPDSGDHTDDPTKGLQYFVETLSRLGCDDVTMCYVDRSNNATYGMSRDELSRRLAAADLLVNVGGVCELDEFANCSRKVVIDLDPGFTQIGDFGLSQAENYDVHLTYGTNIGAADCGIPVGPIDWIPTNPPVVIDFWRPHVNDPVRPAFTTVANLDAYGDLTLDGRRYGQKLPSFRLLGDLPRRVPAQLEVALSSANEASLSELTAAGWTLEDGVSSSRALADYVQYLTSSAGEFSVAKEAYVALRTGWFSDRSVCYLAAGRPVVVQDTGFAGGRRFDDGIVTWNTADEAEVALTRVLDDPVTQQEAALQLADELFDHRRVLTRIIGLAG